MLDRVGYFLAGLPSPEEILAFRANEEDARRFDFLIGKRQREGLSTAEEEELLFFTMAEEYMRTAKAKALSVMDSQQQAA